MNRKIIIVIIVLIIPLLSGFFIWKKKERKTPYIADVNEKKINYLDFNSYALNFDGEYIYTDSYKKINTNTGEINYPQIFSIYRMMTRWENNEKFVKFSIMSISPDERYLVFSVPIKSSINPNTPDLLAKSKIIDLQTGTVRFVKDDFVILSWNPNKPDLLISSYGYFRISTEDNEINLTAINSRDKYNYSNSEKVGNGMFIWDKQTFAPLAKIDRIDNTIIIENSDLIKTGLFDTPFVLFEENYANGKNTPIGFDLSGEYFLYLKRENQNSTIEVNYSLWMVDLNLEKKFELFRISEYDDSRQEIVNVTWSIDNTYIVIERKNESFLIIELLIP